ncbi:hypothetical protein ACFRMN_06940 [Streptomyces sp. NPDC056835]|uniref:hypothetical protein n=1 Tax=Streptomyces sp. NPDC056835 TaxID=3345956 RepID=UPI0036CD3271
MTTNKVPAYNCNACADECDFEICDGSTDALIRYIRCTACPTMPPVWKPREPFWRSFWKRTPAELAAEAACPF